MREGKRGHLKLKGGGCAKDKCFMRGMLSGERERASGGDCISNGRSMRARAVSARCFYGLCCIHIYARRLRRR